MARKKNYERLLDKPVYLGGGGDKRLTPERRAELNSLAQRRECRKHGVDTAVTVSWVNHGEAITS